MHLIDVLKQAVSMAEIKSQSYRTVSSLNLQLHVYKYKH